MEARGLCRRGSTCSHHQGQGVTCSESVSWLMGRTCCTRWLDVGLCQQRSQVRKDEVRALGENSRIHSKEQCATCYRRWYHGKVFCSLCPLLSFFFPFPSSLLSPFPYPSFLFPPHPAFNFLYSGARTCQPVFVSISALIYTTLKFCMAVTSLRYLCPGGT